MNNELKQYEVVPGNLDTLKAKIVKLNRKAVKLGTSPIVLTVVGEKFVNRITEGGVNRKERKILVTVTGETPKLNGWTITTVIEHTEGGNILRAVPPFTLESLDSKYRTVAATCDHCGYDRRRKDTYIVRHDDGRTAQVGRTCLKDFTGHNSPEAIATWAECVSMLDGMIEGFCGTGSEYYFDLKEVLTLASCVIRRDGFVSKKAAMENDRLVPTASVVSWLLRPSVNNEDAQDKLVYVVADSDESLAELAQEWASTQEPKVEADYLWNLRVVANMEAITSRNFGLAVSMISAYQREVGRLAEIERQRANRPVSQFVGTIGKREEFTVTVKKLVGCEGSYGHTTLHIMEDQAGNKLSWFASGYAKMEENCTYVIKATVKAQEVYRGENQTQLTRASVVSEVGPVALPDAMVLFPAVA